MTRKWLPYLVAASVYGLLAVAYHFAVSPLFENQFRELGSPSRHYYELYRDVMNANGRYRAIMIKDSILPLIPRTPGVFVRLPQTDSSSEYLQRKAAQAWGANPAAAVGVMGVAVEYGDHPRVPEHNWSSLYFSGIVDGTPYCVWVLPLHSKQATDVRMYARWRNPMDGPCALWARYGGPGPNILQWLDRSGRRFARSSEAVGRSDYESFHFVNLPWVSSNRWFASLRGQRCLGGDLSACETALMMTDSDAETGRYYGMSQPGLFWGEASMLVSVEKQFGPDRFSAFWHSSQPVPAAFQAAFGMPMSKWVHDWGVGIIGPLETGARASAGSVVLSLLVIALFVGGAVLTVHHRHLS